MVLHVLATLNAEGGLVAARVLAGDCLPNIELHMSVIVALSFHRQLGGIHGGS